LNFFSPLKGTDILKQHIISSLRSLAVFKQFERAKKAAKPRQRAAKQATQATLSAVIFFSAQYPKRNRKSSRCGPFEAEKPRYKNWFFNL